ncbi:MULTISPECIES: hypothetical protein [Bacteroidaceae]|nr:MULTISPECIES: hypothetical protein [Bacteroidaceae]
METQHCLCICIIVYTLCKRNAIQNLLPHKWKLQHPDSVLTKQDK